MSTANTVRRFILYCYHCYFQLLGITAVHIDLDRRIIHKSRLRSIYTLCVNLLHIALFPVVYEATYRHFSVVNENELVKFTDVAQVWLLYGGMLLTMALRWSRDRRCERVAHELFSLDANYFSQLHSSEPIENRFNRLLFIQFICFLSHAFELVYCSLQLGTQLDLEMLLIAIYYAHTQYIIHGVAVDYLVALWQCCKRFDVLNHQLRQILDTLKQFRMPHQANQLQQLSESATTSLSNISLIHRRLANVVSELNGIYKFETIALMLCNTYNNVVFYYYAILVADGSLHVGVSGPLRIFGVLTISLLLADPNIFLWVCDVTALQQQRTAAILKQFGTLPLINVEFERQCEIFCLDMARHKVNISVGGLFTLNMQTSMALWSFTIRHVVILIQYDYEHRLRHLGAKYQK